MTVSQRNGQFFRSTHPSTGLASSLSSTPAVWPDILPPKELCLICGAAELSLPPSLPSFPHTFPLSHTHQITSDIVCDNLFVTLPHSNFEVAISNIPVSAILDKTLVQCMPHRPKQEVVTMQKISAAQHSTLYSAISLDSP